jgi:hypothetical protein
MEMTALDAFQGFGKRNSGLVRRSTFYSLLPRNVKIISPHETCMCIYHENMHLLLQMHKVVIVRLSNNSKILINMEQKLPKNIQEILYFNSREVYEE